MTCWLPDARKSAILAWHFSGLFSAILAKHEYPSLTIPRRYFPLMGNSVVLTIS
uniref:Uncharacterized protein n=1 Tax=Siphoviridae sp. ctVzN31 TaxID=2825534 RepID=A0A8S5NWC2_9CAUD|nr:MAG TPA: hypothetical protein [Siphoviridae sp. ctVzN31]